MNYLKFKRLNKLIFFFSFVVMLFTSCGNDDNVVPTYVGTWTHSFTTTVNGTSYQYKFIKVFSKSGFSDVYQIYEKNTSKWLDYVKINGETSVADSLITQKATEVGVALFSQSTGYPVGTITMYKAGTSNFDHLLLLTGHPVLYDSKFVVVGDKMTIMTDANNDGDYLDINEKYIYTKQ